jgi:hypothetical protein
VTTAKDTVTPTMPAQEPSFGANAGRELPTQIDRYGPMADVGLQDRAKQAAADQGARVEADLQRRLGALRKRILDVLPKWAAKLGIDSVPTPAFEQPKMFHTGSNDGGRCWHQPFTFESDGIKFSGYLNEGQLDIDMCIVVADRGGGSHRVETLEDLGAALLIKPPRRRRAWL